jgi:hypothetical protein
MAVRVRYASRHCLFDFLFSQKGATFRLKFVKNVPIEFRRRLRVSGAQSNVADTGVLNASLLLMKASLANDFLPPLKPVCKAFRVCVMIVFSCSQFGLTSFEMQGRFLQTPQCGSDEGWIALR